MASSWSRLSEFAERHHVHGRVFDRAPLLAFAVGLCLATAALVGFGFVATREWQRGSELLIHRRQNEVIALAAAALSRDMRGAWTTVIVPTDYGLLEQEPPYNLLQLIARNFARFPYPESFVVWRETSGHEGVTYVFNRADRRPSWVEEETSGDTFPVVMLRNPSAVNDLVSSLRGLATAGTSFLVVDRSIRGSPYQIVAHLLYSSVEPHALSGLVAFTVNLQWIREQYFGPLLQQVARIGDNEETLTFLVMDPNGTIVTRTGSGSTDRAGIERRFPLLFLDPSVLPPEEMRTPLSREWTLRVIPSRDDALLSAQTGARGTFALIVVAAFVSIILLLLTVRTDQARVNLAAMKSDFVSAVTHELKTPVALIRLVGDTLAKGRYASADVVQEYARLLSQEALRLSRSIDGLLTYAKYSDAARSTSADLRRIELKGILDSALERYALPLSDKHFELTVDVPEQLEVMAEAPSLVQVMENIIDNAIKYCRDKPALRITGRRLGSHVRLTFSDNGIGIDADDLGHVCDQFYRGRNASEAGSGLGLTIAQRIMEHQGGRIEVRSASGVGTDVILSLAAASKT
jgi:signal transduction histidine kinase